jgi:hypothetical protein
MNLKYFKSAFENPFDPRSIPGLLKFPSLLWVAGWSG